MTESVDEQPVVLVDAYNLFIRSYSAFPSMTTGGEQAGGVVGFLKTLEKIANDVRPNRIYVVWEGGGSPRRRALFKEYKAKKKPEKLNRFYEDDIPDSDENRVKQVAMLTRLLKLLPVCQLYVADCEADDVIAYLCRARFHDVQKVIVSSDKDFYQLLDEKTRVYSLHKKAYFTADDVKRDTGITTKNFALAKSFCGDGSDNIPGVDGLGFKTLVKRFPFFGGDTMLSIDDVMSFARARLRETPIFRRVVENEQLVRRNWELVYLGDLSLASNQMERIDYLVETFKPGTNKIELIRQLIADGIQKLDVDRLYLAFLGVSYA